MLSSLLFSVTRSEIVGIFDLPKSAGSIEKLEVLPSSHDFFHKYARGWGKPVLFKGAAKHMAAAQWTDEYLRKEFGNVNLDTVEHAKKETRVAPSTEMNLQSFLSEYNTSEIYTVSALPTQMREEVLLTYAIGNF